ncbi:unnamed protein product, partial [Strongylus vulgaris]
ATTQPIQEILPISDTLPTPKNLQSKEFPTSFPIPGNGSLPLGKIVFKNETLSKFPKPKTLPDKEFPLNFPIPTNRSLEIASTNKTLETFPSPKILHTKEFPSNFPLPGDDKTLNQKSASAKELSHVSPKPLEFKEKDLLEDLEEGDIKKEESTDALAQNVSLANLPTTDESPVGTSATIADQEEIKKIDVTGFIRPGNLSATPVFLTLIKRPKVPTSHWYALPQIENLTVGGNSDRNLIIALPSIHSTGKANIEASPINSNPLVLSVPLSGNLPLNVTITRKKKVKRLRSEMRNERELEEESATTKSKPKKGFPQKIRMIPKTQLKKVDQERLETSIPEVNLEEEIPTTKILPSVLETTAAKDNWAKSEDALLTDSKNVDAALEPSTEATTEWGYVTAPGERTAAPEVLLRQAAEEEFITAQNEPVPIEENPQMASEFQPKESLEEMEQQSTNDGQLSFFMLYRC